MNIRLEVHFNGLSSVDSLWTVVYQLLTIT
jgi:hypothetical protein